MKIFLDFFPIAMMEASAPIRRVISVLGVWLFISCLILLPSTALAVITATELTSSGSSQGRTSYTTDSITPSANYLILAWVTNTKDTTPDLPTLTGNGLTWVQVTSVTWSSSTLPTARTTLFRAMGSSPTSGAVTINLGSGTQTGCLWSIIQFGNVDTSGTSGSGAVVQSAVGRTDGAGTSGLSITLNPLADAGNATAGGFSNRIDSTTSISAGTGYTAFTGASINNPDTSLRTEWRTPGSTTVNVTQSATSDIAGIAVEIRQQPTLTLYNHTVGQAPDQFTTTTPVTAVLFRFDMQRVGTVTVDNLRVNFTTTGGVASADVTACELWQDIDNDGVVDDPGDTLIQGSVTPVGGVITFTTNFTPGTGFTDYLVRATVANLVPGDTTTFSLGTADIDEVEAGVVESGSISSATHTQNGTLTLGDHTLGQIGDQFTTTTPVTAVLFRFNLTRAGLVTVSTIRVYYTTGGGVVDADVTAATLYRDNNNDGAVDGGDTALMTSSGSGGQLVFAALNESPGTGGTNYLVQATVANLVAGDTTTFSLNAAGIDESQANIEESGSISNATHTQNSTLELGDHSVLGQVGDQFTTTSPVTAVLFRFTLRRTGSLTVTQLRVHYTTGSGVQDADVTNGELYVDGNHNGLVDDGGGATIQTGVAGAGGMLTFTNSFSPGTGWTDYLVRATVANLNGGDTTTFSLAGADIDESESVGESGTISSTTHTQDNLPFDYRKPITVKTGPTGMIGSSCGSNLIRFPVLISITDTDLRDHASTSGCDIIFRALDANICTPEFASAPCTLHHELEKYDSSTGTLVAWVQIPTLDYNDNTVIYMYYGNSSISDSFPCTSSTANPTVVWSNGYAGVWHLKETAGGAGAIKNSTANTGLDGTDSGSPTFGATPPIIDGAIGFDGTDDRIAVTDPGTGSVLDFGTGASITLSAWIRPGSLSSSRTILTKNMTNGSAYENYSLATNLSQLEFCYYGGIGYQCYDTNSSGMTTGNWYHTAFTYTFGTGASATIYVNGALKAGTWTSGNGNQVPTQADDQLWLGDNKSGQRFNGIIDEVRISSVARDLCWIETEYKNQNEPGNTNYIEFGTQQGPGVPTAVKLTSFTATQYSEGILLRWKTGYEVRNLGFHIYREENGQLIRLTPEPVAGSAFLAGSRTALRAGHHYHWWDTSAIADVQGPLTLKDRPLASRTIPKVAGLEDRKSFASSEALLKRSAPQAQRSVIHYWLKDIDLNGTETMHGPAEIQSPVNSDPLSVSKMIKPELLGELGMRLEQRYHHYWKARELKEKLALKRLEVRGSPHGHGLRTGNKVPLRSGPTGFEGRGFHRKPDPAGIEVQRYLAGKSAVKILVKEEGWYRVTQPELVAVGLSPKCNPRFLQLFADGREQPMGVIGEKDGRFGPQDAIEFYGAGLDTPSTDVRVYWLMEGLRPGKRVQSSHSQGGQIVSSSFPHTVEVKDRWIYLPAIKNGEEENFFGAVVYGTGADQLLGVKHLDLASSEDAFLEVALQGATNVSHRVRVLLNKEEVGEVVFEGQSKGLLQVEVPQSFLLEGDNLVSLIPLGGEMDVSLVDSIRLTYWHTYTADDNGLRLAAQGGEQRSIGGFGSSGIRVFDITEPTEVIEVFGKVESEKGSYAISFRVPGTGQRVLLALTGERVRSPEGITSNQPSSWHQSKDGCDLVIVTHRDFLDTLQPLKKLRESQGLKVSLIDVEDLYDEFTFGNKTPKAIKDFLASAKSNWRRAPRFVLLVGDTSLDPKNYFGLRDLDFVPTKLIDTQYLETASDDWFVDLKSDGLPEMAIGRLPVQTAEEAAIVVSKTIGYERSSKKNEALLVADRVDNSDDYDFEGASEEIWGLLPSSLSVRKIYRSQFSSDAQANGVLLGAINQGPLLVNFIGHGSIEIWRGNIFTSEDAEGLINGMRLPFFVNMTCLNGYFQDPYSETLGEALIKAKGGGAIAVWTSSGLTEPDKQAVMNKELIQLLFNGQSFTLGEATAKAKKVVSDQDVRKTWILFGDPTTRLK